MVVFGYTDYRKLLLDLLFLADKKSRGQNARLAKALDVHTSQISQILKGTRELSLDQAFLVTEFFSLTELEARYFVTLVSLERAAHFKAKKFYQTELERLKKESEALENRLKVERLLDDEKLAVFYSSPLYSQVRLLLSIKHFQKRENLKSFLNIDDKRLDGIFAFLEQNKLIVKEGKGFVTGPAKTHLPKESSMILQHHKNWRLKAMEKQQQFDQKDIFYSGPMVLSEKDYGRLKEMLKKNLEDIYSVVGPSPSEKMYCLNIDCFEVNS